MSSCDCAKKREWVLRRKWLIEIFDKQCREEKNCMGKMMKDSVWFSFMKDRYGTIDPTKPLDEQKDMVNRSDVYTTLIGEKTMAGARAR